MGEARRFKAQFGLEDADQEEGIVQGDSAESALMSEFTQAMKAHRVWSRSQKAQSVPA